MAVRWSVKQFFAPNFPIFWENSGEEEKEDGENRQMESVLFLKQTLKDAKLNTRWIENNRGKNRQAWL